MRKKHFSLLCLCIFLMTQNLFTNNMRDGEIPTPIPLTYIDPSLGGNPIKRTPIAIPVLFLDGYTLTAGDYTIGSTIQLLDDDGDVVFSSYVYIEGDIELPTTLSGTYTIKIIRGSQTFEGEIDL